MKDQQDALAGIRLEDMDMKALQALEQRLTKEISSRGIKEIERLEEEANQLRESLGYKRRPPLRQERRAKAK